ncbi:hypothetical protein ACFVU3_02875 [Streptomyces sp. NPDC058052]|uniref:hypothetical protein n=1 Tax=Streptomyces sp. NPDC058052 TaxID=3346316 RepID=UPI0036E007C4
MSASEKSGQNALPWTGPYAVPDYPDMPEAYDPDLADTDDPDLADAYDPAGMGDLRVLPAPSEEKARTAGQRARGAGNALWTAVRARKAVTAGAAVGTAAVIALVYARGRRAGLRAGRRGLGPVALLLERRC